MIAIVVLLLAIGLSLVITRTAAVMLELTGMSRDSARFQSRAAYCGVGYNSPETQCIVEHPVRRRIISTLMLLGNAGTATVVSTMIISFTADANEPSQHPFSKILVVAAGLLVLFFAARSELVDAWLTKFVQWCLRSFSSLDLKDYTALLHSSKGYSVLEVEVQDGDWLGGRSLATLALPKEGVLVLGIRRPDGEYIGAPSGRTEIGPGDTLLVYGRLTQLEELNQRKHGTSGIYAHLAAVTERAKDASDEQEETDS